MDRVLRSSTRAGNIDVFNGTEQYLPLPLPFSTQFQLPPFGLAPQHETVLTVDDFEDDQTLKYCKANWKEVVGGYRKKKKRKPRKLKTDSDFPMKPDRCPTDGPFPKALNHEDLVNNYQQADHEHVLAQGKEGISFRNVSSSTAASVTRGIEQLSLGNDVSVNAHQPTYDAHTETLHSSRTDRLSADDEAKQAFPVKITFIAPTKAKVNSRAKPFVCRPIPGREAPSHNHQHGSSEAQNVSTPTPGHQAMSMSATHQSVVNSVADEHASTPLLMVAPPQDEDSFLEHITARSPAKSIDTTSHHIINTQVSDQTQSTGPNSAFRNDRRARARLITFSAFLLKEDPVQDVEGNSPVNVTSNRKDHIKQLVNILYEHDIAQALYSQSYQQDINTTNIGSTSFKEDELSLVDHLYITRLFIHRKMDVLIHKMLYGEGPAPIESWIEALLECTGSQVTLEDTKAYFLWYRQGSRTLAYSNVRAAITRARTDLNHFRQHEQESQSQSTPLAVVSVSDHEPDSLGRSLVERSETPDKVVSMPISTSLSASGAILLTPSRLTSERCLRTRPGAADGGSSTAAAAVPSPLVEIWKQVLQVRPTCAVVCIGKQAPESRSPAAAAVTSPLRKDTQSQKVQFAKSSKQVGPTRAVVRTGKQAPDLRSVKTTPAASLQLPGDVLSQRKREIHEAKLKAQAEEDRKRREFKAKPVRSVKATVLPKDTAASLKRKALITQTLSKTESMPRQKFNPSGKIDVDNAPRTPIKSNSHRNNLSISERGSPQGKIRTIQKSGGAESKLRKEHNDVEKEKHEREERAKTARLCREQAAERGREAARAWANKRR